MITNSIIIAFFIYLIIKHVFYGNTIIEGVSTNSDTSNAAAINTIGVTQKSHKEQIEALNVKYNKLQKLLNSEKLKGAINSNASNTTLVNSLQTCCNPKTKTKK